MLLPLLQLQGGEVTAPFGIDLGSHVDSLTIVEELAAGKYFITAATPHPNFSSYLVQASPSFGVVWIKGISDELENDGYGINARALVDRIGGQLSTKYGPGDKSDWRHPDGLWEDTKDWTMALLQGERGYFYIWDRSKQRGLPHDIESIYVGAMAIDTSSTKVVLEYSSTSLAAAEAELDNNLANLL